MSATADTSVMSGGNDASLDHSRLQQPTDAVAMKSMPQSSQEGGIKSSTDENTASSKDTPRPAESSTDAEAAAEAESTPSPVKGKEKEGAQKPLQDRQDSGMAIGPAQDEIKAAATGPGENGPVCNITLLLTSGSRHPYKIDARYLGRRNVVVPEKTESGLPDPFSISIYTLKELILREWRNDWEAKPASPSSIRLIHFGKLLDDKEPLKTYNFLADSPNVVHMSIRPQDLDEEEPKTGGKNATSGGGDGPRERSGGCCVVL